MTEKRFTYIKNSSISQYQSIPIQKIGKGKPFHCQGIVDELNKLWNENEELKSELKIYRKVANCRNCDYHDYDCREDGDDFEICKKGNDVTEGICEDWREL